MSHIKLLSVPQSWTLMDIIAGLKRAFNWKNEEESIKLVHLEDLSNGRRHVRVSFHNPEMIKKIMNSAKETNVKDLRSIKINNSSILIQIKNNTQERFKIKYVPADNLKLKKSIIAVQCSRYADKKILISGLKAVNLSIEYISLSHKNCFVKFTDAKSSQKFMKFLASQQFRYKLSVTFVELYKITQNYEKKESNSKLLKTKVESPKQDSNVVIPKLLESVNQISNSIAKVIENQNTSLANNSHINLFNNLVNRNLEPMNNSNALINMQHSFLPQNVQFMLGLMRMHHVMNQNPF